MVFFSVVVVVVVKTLSDIYGQSNLFFFPSLYFNTKCNGKFKKQQKWNKGNKKQKFHDSSLCNIYYLCLQHQQTATKKEEFFATMQKKKTQFFYLNLQTYCCIFSEKKRAGINSVHRRNSTANLGNLFKLATNFKMLSLG